MRRSALLIAVAARLATVISLQLGASLATRTVTIMPRHKRRDTKKSPTKKPPQRAAAAAPIARPEFVSSETIPAEEEELYDLATRWYGNPKKAPFVLGQVRDDVANRRYVILTTKNRQGFSDGWTIDWEGSYADCSNQREKDLVLLAGAYEYAAGSASFGARGARVPQ